MYSVNKMDITNFKGAIFDLDGTLFDSVGIWKDVDHAFFERREIEMPDDYQECIKDMHFRTMAIYTKERFSLPDDINDIMDEWCELCYEEYENKIRCFPFGIRHRFSKKCSVFIGFYRSALFFYCF